jgi:hypothetical protein
MKYSVNQKRAIAQIDKLVIHFGIERWFTQGELAGVGYHTMTALVNKGHLERAIAQTDVNFVSYYRMKSVV